MAVIAVAAGDRAGICITAVPTPIRSVREATHARVETASEPYASALQIASKPAASASRTRGMTSVGPEPQYPRCTPNLMRNPSRCGRAKHTVEPVPGDLGGRIRPPGRP